MLIHVGGDGSHLALLDASQYPAFVGSNWSDDNRLYCHLLAAANKRTAIAWRTGFEADWRVDVSAGITTRPGFREFSAPIVNSSDRLFLVNYDSLTMAAQFEDHALPDKETLNYTVPLPQGGYMVRVVQMFDPKSKWWESLAEAPAFLVEYEPSALTRDASPGVAWWNEL